MSSLNVYVTCGAGNHFEGERATDDYYATPSDAVELLLKHEKFSKNIWECACGGGHISKVLLNHGYNVHSTDLVYRGFGEKEPCDFLSCPVEKFDGDIITNPPYKYALEFVDKAVNTVSDGHKVAMFLRLQFLEGKRRGKFFEKYPPSRVYVSTGRFACAKNGDFEAIKKLGGAMALAWFVWDKDYKGEPIIRWM